MQRRKFLRTTGVGVAAAATTGAIAAPAALMNAITDALGGRIIDMPATQEKVWRAAQGLALSAAAE